MASTGDESTAARLGRVWEQIAAGMIRWRLFLLLAAATLGLLALGPSLRLSFDRSIESMFPPDDPRLLHFQEGEAAFGAAETAVVGFSDPDLLTTDGFRRLTRLDKQLDSLEGVAKVGSLARARLPGSLLSTRSLLDELEDGSLTPAALRRELMACDLYRGRLISDDGETTVLLVTFAQENPDAPPRNETIQRIRQICQDHDPPAVIVGGPILINEVYEHLERDGRNLGVASAVVLALVIALLFRNLRWIILPLAVVHLTLVWTKGVLVLSGVQLSMVSSPLVALVTVIGAATVVHVAIRFREERVDSDPLTAMRRTIIHIFPAIFWTCVTTALGFSSLMASRVGPVASFGGMMAMGSAFVFAAAVGLLPGGVLLGGRFTDPLAAPGESRLTKLLDWIIVGVEKRPWQVALTVGCLIVAMSVGALRLQVATEFDENFHESHPIVTSYRFLISRMKTTKTVDVLIDVPDLSKPGATADFLERIRRMQDDLLVEDGVMGTLSVVDILDFVTQSRQDSTDFTSRIASLMTPTQRLQTLQAVQPRLLDGFWNREKKVMRVVLQVGEVRGAGNKIRMIELLRGRAQKHFPEARVSGIAILMTYLVQNLLSDQWITFAYALVTILVMLAIAFRNWRLALIALVPNAAPILMVIGAMGWLEMKVNIATAMLASVSMGLAVDFSIHYLFRFQHELRRGRSFSKALRAAHNSVGLAMVLANLALIAGFSTMLMSSFVPTAHFGLLVSVAMLGGLMGNLTALPLLLRYFSGLAGE